MCFVRFKPGPCRLQVFRRMLRSSRTVCRREDNEFQMSVSAWTYPLSLGLCIYNEASDVLNAQSGVADVMWLLFCQFHMLTTWSASNVQMSRSQIKADLWSPSSHTRDASLFYGTRVAVCGVVAVDTALWHVSDGVRGTKVSAVISAGPVVTWCQTRQEWVWSPRRPRQSVSLYSS